MTQLIVNVIVWLLIAGFVYMAAQKIVAIAPIDAWFKQIIDVLIWILVAAIVLFSMGFHILHLVRQAWPWLRSRARGLAEDAA